MKLFLEWPLWIQLIVGTALICLLLLVVLLLAIPLGKILNIEEKQKFSEHDYLQGILHSDLEPGKTGEVLLKGAFGGRDVKPCRMFSEDAEILPRGTQVVVITITSGIAYVVKQTTVF